MGLEFCSPFFGDISETMWKNLQKIQEFAISNSKFVIVFTF